MGRNSSHNIGHSAKGSISESAILESGSVYQQEVIRDLHWLIYSPSLMTPPDNESSDWLFNIPEIDSHLARLDQNPQPLIDELRQQAQFRLGYYFEDLVRFYIKTFIQPIELKYNIQVSREKATVGEYDFLMALQNSINVHIEAAVKFYLCTTTDVNHCHLRDFIGPNRSDRLDRKWQRLTEHQLQLSKTDAGKTQAMALGLLPDRHSLLLRGYLFYPFAQWQAYNPPAPVNPDHLKGWWIRASETDALGEHYQYIVLMKPRWLALDRCCFQETLSRAELAEITERSITTPMLIARLVFKEGRWHEADRGFIVPDNWNLQI
ncbi:DUF1853 family protein [Amphritea pacifica]|uniref:DUF1853 family protein n=1 Tax=Amphritea pacifica TaxID=2811233 RepID=UPI001966BAE5|nr:DUF1853 family protein [Amphritea pacifica]MBN1005468.1 DUF1853 family protein [Amphritea pacifica]